MARADRTPRVSAAVFQNPAARAFEDTLVHSNDLGPVTHTLGRIVGLSEDVGLDECQAAVAAAAVVAALHDRQDVELPEPLARHLANAPKPHRELVGLAVEALERVCSGDELAQCLPGEALNAYQCEVESLFECLRPAVLAPLMEQEELGGSPAAP